jgi:hypothetical protein
MDGAHHGLSTLNDPLEGRAPIRRWNSVNDSFISPPTLHHLKPMG